MKVVESIRGAMDAFDAFYDSTSRQETDDAKRKAISTIVLSKGEWGTPKGLEVLATRLTDLVVSSTEETRAMTGPEVGQLILAVLGTDPQTGRLDHEEENPPGQARAASRGGSRRRQALPREADGGVGEPRPGLHEGDRRVGRHPGVLPRVPPPPGDLRPGGRLPAGEQEPRRCLPGTTSPSTTSSRRTATTTRRS